MIFVSFGRCPFRSRDLVASVGIKKSLDLPFFHRAPVAVKRRLRLFRGECRDLLKAQIWPDLSESFFSRYFINLFTIPPPPSTLHLAMGIFIAFQVLSVFQYLKPYSFLDRSQFCSLTPSELQHLLNSDFMVQWNAGMLLELRFHRDALLNECSYNSVKIGFKLELHLVRLPNFIAKPTY